MCEHEKKWHFLVHMNLFENFLWDIYLLPNHVFAQKGLFFSLSFSCNLLLVKLCHHHPSLYLPTKQWMVSLYQFVYVRCIYIYHIICRISSAVLLWMEIYEMMWVVVCVYVDAAILMLKKKIHRIPIVNEVNQLVGEWDLNENYEASVNVCCIHYMLLIWMIRWSLIPLHVIPISNGWSLWSICLL